MILHLYEWFINNSAEILIGTSALILTTVTVYQTRKHNRLSITPHLNTFLDHGDKEVTLILLNNGIGPARIDDITVFIRENDFKGDLKQIAFNQIQDVLLECLTIEYAIHLGSNYSLLPGSKHELIKVSISDSEYTRAQIERNLKQIHLLIGYSSFYGDTFTLDTRKTFWNSQDE